MSQSKDGVSQEPTQARPVIAQEPPVPVALEELLGMAAATPAFSEALLKDPLGAAEASRLALTATEAAILRAMDQKQLTVMIGEVGAQLPQAERRAFLEQAALAIAVLVGSGVAVAGAGCRVDKTTNPSANQSPAGMEPPPEPDASTPVMVRDPPVRKSPTRGIRPDRVHPKGPDPGKITGSRPIRRKKPMRPRRILKTAGVRPMHPPNTPPTFGMRPPHKIPKP